MDYFKILLFLFSAGLLLDLSNANKPSKPWQNNTRKTNRSPDDHQKCICFPDGDLPIVQQLLDPNDNGLQRIVVYLYINDLTNEIKMYTPSAKKQMLIPDLLYEPTDGLVDVTPDNVYPLIYGNPSKIKVYNNRFEALQPEVSHALPIGLNVGAIEHVLPPVTDEIHNSNGNEYALDSSVAIPNAQIAAHVSDPQHGSSVDPENINSNIYFPTEGNTYITEPTQPYWMSDNTDYPNWQGQAFPEHPQSSTGYGQASPSSSQSTPNNIQTSTGHLQAFPIISQGIAENAQPITGQVYGQAFPSNFGDLPENIQISVTNPQAYPINSQGIPENANFLPGYVQAYPIDSQSTPDNIQSSIINVQAVPSISQGIPENIQIVPGYVKAYPSNPQGIPGNTQSIIAHPQTVQSILDKPQGYWDNSQHLLEKLEAKPLNGEIDQHVVYTFPTNQDQGSHPGAKGIQKSYYMKYVTFDVWFSQQMKRFQSIHLPSDIKTIDGEFLRQLVLKTLSDNNILINDDGIITDSNGALIDVSNLELRPLLIGEKISQRITQNSHSPIILPKHLPYLEGILVTFVSPPQILGIIPLGKTYLLKNTPFSGLTVNSYRNKNPDFYTSSEPHSLIVKASYTVPIISNADSIDYDRYVSGRDQPIPLAHSSFANEGPQTVSAGVEYWSTEPSTQPPFVTNYVQTLPSMRRKQTDVKIEHLVEPLMKTRKKNRGLVKKRTDLKKDVELITPEVFPNVNGSESGRRFSSFSLQSFMKTLLNLIEDPPNRRDLEDSSEESDNVEDSENENDREGPNFRIIGGSAATGSGSPVSNKGRSGYTESI